MIEPLSSDDAYLEPLFSPDTPSWDKIGQIALYTFSLIAVSAFIPAAFKKKRDYTVLSTGAEAQVGVIQNTVAEISLPEGNGLPVPKCSAEDAQRIREIFQKSDALDEEAGSLASWQFWKLPQKLIKVGTTAWDLVREGDRLKEHKVHPFAFLKEVPKNHLLSIFRKGSAFKIGKILEGIKDGMERENNTLSLYMRAFAADMGNKDPEKVRQLIQVGFQETNWQPLVRYLFDINS